MLREEARTERAEESRKHSLWVEYYVPPNGCKQLNPIVKWWDVYSTKSAQNRSLKCFTAKVQLSAHNNQPRFGKLAECYKEKE